METPIRVLVVDDDAPHAEAVAESLERVGYACAVATTGKQGLALIEERDFDIVLGKLTASSLSSIYGLLAIFPIMGVPLLLGGVAPAEF